MSCCRRARPSGNGETLSATAPRKAAEVFGPKPIEARSGQPEGRSARRRLRPMPNPLSFEGPAEPEAPGRMEPRKDDPEASLRGRPIGKRISMPHGGEFAPARETRPAFGQGADPAGDRPGVAIFR